MKTVNIVVSLLCFLCTIGLIVKIDNLNCKIKEYQLKEHKCQCKKVCDCDKICECK